MKSKTKQIIIIGVVLFQSLFAYPLITMAEENESKSVNTETTLEPKVALEEKTPQKPSLTNNLKQEKTVLQAGETYETVFPDAALATVIAKAATGSEDITQEVSQTDLNKITSLTGTSKGIVDLTGIDLLSKLTSLSISGNQITDISALNGLVNLSNLNVSNNKITSFNLNANSNLPMLSTVNIRSNNLKNINVQDQPKLRTIECDTGSSSELTEVTLKNLPILIAVGTGSSAYQNDIVFSSTPGLSKVILENLPSTSSEVKLDHCAIEELVINNLPKVSVVIISYNKITTLEGLENLSAVNTLYVSENLVTEIESMHAFPKLQKLELGWNALTNVVMDQVTAEKFPLLRTMNVSGNNLIKVNIQDQPKLWTFECDTGSSSELTEVTLKNLPTLIAAGNGSSAYQDDIVFSSTPGLSKVILENLPSTSSEVKLDHCAIEELVINNLPKVSVVIISYNKITTLEGLENLSAVNTLYVSENLVTEIESMHAFPKLQKLELGWNALTNVVMDQVTAEKFPLLRTMNVRGNNLIKINIQDQPKLWTFECDTGNSSELTEVTLKNLPTLIAASSGSNDIAFSRTPGLSKVILENLPSTNSEVNLDHCAIEELVINNLPKVSMVDISYNKITTLEGLENLSAVNTLYVSENLVTEIESMHAFPKLQKLTVDNNHISVLPTSLKTENPVLTTLSAKNQTITLKQKVIVSDLVLDNEVKNFGQITNAKSISNKGTYQNDQIKWLFEDIKSVNAVDYQFSESVQEATIQGTFSGKVTQPIKASKVPVITADAEMNYPKNEAVSEAAFFKDISASVTDDATLTSDFESVVDLAKAGTYEVTLNAMNEDGVEAASVTVLVHIAKSPAPVITTDKEITYTKNAEVSITEFLAAIHAKTNDGSPIESDFATAVNWSTAGDYTVTLKSTNEDGVEAIPVEVTVHIAKSPAPVITADKEITYAKNAEVSITEFLAAIHAKTSDGSSIEADLDTAVTWGTVGDYTVTLRSTNEDGVEAIPVEVTVHIAKSPAPVITADKKITYTKNAEVSITEFLAAIHAKTSDGSPIESDFATAVTWSAAGDYTVTLRSTNEDGVEAIPVEVKVHIVEPLAPTISNVTFDVDDVQTTESLEAGELISEPLSPTKEGYTFIGWYDEKTGGNKWDFTTDKMPAYNIILYAQFSKDTNKAEAAGGDKPSTPSSIKVSPTGQSESGNLENRFNVKLPATGDDNATVLLVGLGLLMLGLFIRLTQKKRAK
ncbi:LapB repeat-containing protein [Listeria monocytogenes]|uniref:LapB repeat-containing protein n=1 Tax=Listeria monocytogenes TaxID=1639 RepID=UPI0013664008|nr:LapB repeat-containing protein [Listeria monocytogenes]MWA36185.1 LPXTG cell wall anchor domain-containing protein [Listeria monocytogenes]MWA78293.1 LPXTG cell wall anchor domain-containing protein [Listeria monocytogenes]MWB41934.1 LPXTG cell wall anchor domain-containing protein [Listeria monocytogenes]MWB44889.1 LPXTG cell wall anchor domain-containing protein [Listeria monocytogenes]